MGASASTLAMGLGVGLHFAQPHQSVGAALLDADFAHNRYRLGSQNFTDEASFLTAIGATKSGIARTISPKVVGSELITNGDFAAGDLTGWNEGSADVAISVVSGAMRLVRGSGAPHPNSPFQRVNFGGFPRAFKLEYDTGVSAIRQYAENPLGAEAAASYDDTPGHFSRYGGTNESLPRNLVDFYWWPRDANTTTTLDNVSVKEVRPLPQYNPDAVGFVIAGKTPAVASGNKVLLQADADRESDRLRIVWDTSSHLRMIVTTSGNEQVNLDLGVVAADTAFEVRISAARDNFRASLNGVGMLTDTVGQLNAVAYLRIGRSFAGEPWEGSIDRVALFNRVLTDVEMVRPQYGLQVYGDSTAAGDGGSVGSRWWELLGTAYDPVRPVNNSGVHGETTSQMLARAQADTTHRAWTTVFMDRPNSIIENDWIDNIKAAVAHLRTDRWLVVPPVMNSPSGLPDGVDGKITEVQGVLLSDPFFAGHTFDAALQASYIGTLNDDAMRVGSGDWTHFNTTGQNVQYTCVKAFLDAQGW